MYIVYTASSKLLIAQISTNFLPLNARVTSVRNNVYCTFLSRYFKLWFVFFFFIVFTFLFSSHFLVKCLFSLLGSRFNTCSKIDNVYVTSLWIFSFFMEIFAFFTVYRAKILIYFPNKNKFYNDGTIEYWGWKNVFWWLLNVRTKFCIFALLLTFFTHSSFF